MKTHHVKSAPVHFNAVWRGEKTAELRVNDRNYKEGDTLVQQEWTLVEGYTGATITATISHVLYTEHLTPGNVMLSLRTIVLEAGTPDNARRLSEREQKRTARAKYIARKLRDIIDGKIAEKLDGTTTETAAQIVYNVFSSQDWNTIGHIIIDELEPKTADKLWLITWDHPQRKPGNTTFLVRCDHEPTELEIAEWVEENHGEDYDGEYDNLEIEEIDVESVPTL
jgi:hypothetical protein